MRQGQTDDGTNDESSEVKRDKEVAKRNKLGRGGQPGTKLKYIFGEAVHLLLSLSRLLGTKIKHFLIRVKFQAIYEHTQIGKITEWPDYNFRYLRRPAC